MIARSVTRLIALLSTCAALAAQAASVEFAPAHSQVSVGQTFAVSLVGGGFAENLDGGGLSVAYDPAVLSFVDATFDPDWDFFTDAGVEDAVAGSLTDLQFNQFGHPKVGSFAIVTLHFRAEALGASPLTLNLGSNPFASGGELVAVDLGNGSVTVVPLPATGGLLALALGACCLRRRT